MDYKLDRNTFSMRNANISEPAIEYWQNKSPEERLSASFYLNSVAFNFNISNPPKLDKTIFHTRKNQ